MESGLIGRSDEHRTQTTLKRAGCFDHISYTDDIIILLNFIFIGFCGYEITPGLSTDKQRHRLLLLKTGIPVALTHLQVMLNFGNILR